MIGSVVIVIFGATGDLARHKLIPALFSLYKHGELGEQFFIVGFSRRDITDQAYGESLAEELQFATDPKWASFAKKLYYQQGLFDLQEGYDALIKRLNGFDEQLGACITRLFYLATPPDHYESILNFLHSTKLSEGCGQGSSKWTRIAIEKPFGKDLETAKHLDAKLAQIFEEKQIFRVDHYLGKETVQNMIAFRFANSVFESVWNNQHIDHVQITWAEKEGIGKRGRFFDGVGMLRDVMQNHLMQLMATVTMESPKSFEKESVRNVRANAIKAIRSLTPKEITTHVVRGQYNGYLSEKDVKEGSQTETFVAMKLFVDSERFANVPFYLRAGKTLEKEKMEIAIVFAKNRNVLFHEHGYPDFGNILTIRVQPDEGIRLRMIAKKPGTSLALEPVDMEFSYEQSFGSGGTDAYEKVLRDIMVGDQMLFNRSDELESSWQLISDILKSWEQQASETLLLYEKGSWGPQEAFGLIEKDGRKWL
ncbi:MAG: glucose-6-phosphate dehydrogenase [Patescibacteria group bacterium]